MRRRQRSSRSPSTNDGDRDAQSVIRGFGGISVNLRDISSSVSGAREQARQLTGLSVDEQHRQQARATVVTNKVNSLRSEVAVLTSGIGREIRRCRLIRTLAVVLSVIAWAMTVPSATAQLGPNCTASLLNRTVQVNADGSFAIGNVPANPQSLYRVRVRCIAPNGSVVQGQSRFLTLTGADSIDIGWCVRPHYATTSQSPGSHSRTPGIRP